MDDLASSIDPDDLMDLDEAEGSDLDEEEDELIDDRLPSPFQFPSSAPPSTATSAASSPHNDDFPQPFNFSGKPLNIKRGRGRPRREGGKPAQRRQSLGGKVRKLKPPGFPKTPKKFKNFLDFESFSYLTPSPGDELPIIDPETGSLIFTEREKPAPVFEELPFFPEQWPGKVCAFCNLAERSQLGQGEMLRLIRPDGFIPQRIVSDVPENLSMQIPERELGDKSPRGPVTCRRQKSFNKCRHPSLTSEYVDELTIIGYIEQPDVSGLFDVNGYFYVHRSCTLWSNGVMKNENSVLENVGPVVLQSSSRKCSFCSHFGASISCKVGGCSKTYHFPCATASGAFQVLNLLSLYCSSHMGQVASDCENIVCYTCKAMGDIANLMYCSTCGEHYHGCCVGLAQLPGVRAGWQCRKCRVCQVCRVTGDESKLMSCEQCDKIYHSTCQRPIVTSIPKYGWKCRCCRVCGDCGSRTPGAGLSSRWHAHYTVCDSCYQQRNKGYCCPLCHRAYRAHAHREMVQCTSCRRFVHGTCDPDADLVTYQQRKEGHPEYDYVCPVCKNLSQPGQLLSKRNSTDDISECLSSSQESPFEDNVAFDFPFPIDPSRTMGLGKGKPYSASKIAKKRLGISNVMPGRPKGVGKGPPGKVGFMKRQRMTEFGRKRGPKAKMRGVFGVPGVGLQRPVSDGKSDEEPGVENRLVLCSAKDKFVLTQDICVMCGALGTDQEGCLIACVQCGQCYHPYCVNVKVTKVILQKGWRCLDCTVCEGCGQRNDESRLILCDDCDISFHIYCMDPPLDYVPHGNWKCKWCAICQSCGATDPGFNCSWMNSFSECGPCASHVTCPSCSEPYSEGDLIIQCVQCERWLHGACDSIKTEDDAEKCAEEGYNCMLCRPRDVPPPHLVPSATCFKPPTPTKSPEMKSNNNYFVDGVYLSESGHNLIKSLSLEQHGTRKKRKKLATVQEKEAGIMATIESVVAGSRANNLLEDGSAKLELVDVKEEPQEIYKEGMIWTKDDGPPPEGFTLFTMDSGVGVLRRKRQRNLQKLGIGGFLVRVRGIRGQDNDDIDVLPGQSNPDVPLPVVAESEKPRRKPIRRKPKSKLAETFPPYLQEAFFGRDLLDSTKDMDSSSSDEEKHNLDHDKTIQLTQDEIRAVAAVNPKRELGAHPLMDNKHIHQQTTNKMPIVPKEEEEDSTEDLKDVLALPGDLLDNELVNTFMNAGDGELVKNAGSLEALTDEADLGNTAPGTKDTKDELSDILGPNFNLESMPNINSKDVEDIFKGVLTDDSQESQESNVFPMQNNNNNSFPANPPQNIAQHQVPPAVRPTSLPTVSQSNMNSPLNFPPQSPYQSEYSNSPQFSPAFSEPPSPWVAMNDGNDLDGSTAGAAASTYNQRSSEKMKADEGLGNGATISAVLYANINHPEWKTEFPNWNERYKQILKKWRTLSQEQKGPYLQQARDNRSALRMKKQQQSQMNKDTSNGTSAASKPSTPVGATVVAAVAVAPSSSIISSTQVPPAIVAPVSEVCTQQSRPTPSLTTASTSSVSVSPPLTPSPTTQQQFTVHGQFPGPGDHCGPAPNVTVNPLYQPPPPTTTTDQVSPPTAPTLRPAVTQQTAPSASDQQIRVLTPSEIMRTLPSLCQENYEPQPPPDQEKVALQHKSAREAEQERQWKHLQALRQQQAQQQQHVIHEQRVQARVQRQISDPSQPFAPESPQEASPVTPPQTPRPLLNMGINIKSPTFVHPSQTVVRPTTPSQPPIEFESDPYTKPPSTPKPQPLPLPQPQFQPRPQTDPYSQQPGTPRPSFPIQRPNFQGARVEGPEINRQLRDLLQRQQFKKLDEHLLAGKGQQRVWPPSQAEAAPETETNTNLPTMNDSTFRHPLPPGNTRPRLPLPVGAHKPALLGLRIQQIDPRMQGIDPRIRPLLQQQQQQRLLQAGAITQQQQFASAGTVRFATGAIRPASVEQYEQLLQRQPQTAFQARGVDAQVAPRLQSVPQMQVPIQRAAQAPIMPQAGNGENNAPSAEQEIPDNVTAELEKLEQETGTMVELQGVSDILGGLGEDDDELLAEVGADFNILEYADTEALPGEKTNILDLELEEDPIKNDRKAKADAPKSGQNPQVNPAQMIKKETTQTPMSQPQNMGNIHPPPLAISQSQSTPQVATGTVSHLTPQQIYQQMLHQVQQAAAHGRPMLPGSKLQTPDGIIGIVTPNNNIQLQVPQSYHQKLLLMQQLQNQKLQMRVGQAVPRMMTAPPNQQGMHPNAVGINPAPRMGLPAPPPPPPPYQKPPPPYPGSATPQQQPQMGLRMGPVHLPPGHMHPMQLQGKPLHPHLQRRPLLLEEQPLLLEDLLEQEKREQEKQNQTQTSANTQPELTSPTTSNVESESPALLSDHDFERLKADVFSSGSVAINPNARQGQVPPAMVQGNWAQTQNRPIPTPTPQPTIEIKVQTFTANLLPPPPLPPENIATEQDKQKQIVYEQWLAHQNNVLAEQLKYYDTEVQKLRKIRKSLNSKQRQLRKSGGQLTDADATELQRISSEQSVLQKHLESSRKLSRQHNLLIQEYRNKQQAKQGPAPGQSPLLLQQNSSPLGPPSSSPIHHSSMSQSPMMSPSASPLTQHNSPMHSPGPLISHSPGSVQGVLQSPGSINNMSPLQPSRIGTPLSQSEGSPGNAASPGQVCLPPPAPRMTSPQHKRVVTSPVGYSGDVRPGTPQMRFVRTPDHSRVARLPSPMSGFPQKPGTPSPLGSPPAQQIMQKHLTIDGQDINILNSPRTAALIQQRNLIRQHLAQQQHNQQGILQPQPLTPQQHQMMVQQQQQLAKQQQLAQIQAQIQAQRLNQQQQQANPPSPMPPKSPLVQQMMSPHSMPASPMPPKSPMTQYGNNQQGPPSSPVTRNFHQPPNSPMGHQYQPPSSPMPRSPMIGQIQSPLSMRRPPSSPASVEPQPVRTPFSMHDNDTGGGGNPYNNPIPAPPGFGRYGYFKLGLRGGSPMWGFGRGAKRIPTPPVTNKDDKNETPVKPKKESHLSKVSILKRKSPAKTNLQSFAVSKVGSLVSTDYNEFDDSSCTPPVTPPPSTSRLVQKTGKKIPEETRVHSPEEKEIMDYDDDNNTVVSGEVSLSSTAQQNDGDDIAVMETFSQNDLGEPMSSPLESDQIPDEYVLFPGNMVVDISGEAQYSDKEEEGEEEYTSGNMHVVIRSPTTSDDELIMQNKTGKKFMSRQDEESNFEESEIVIIDPSVKSPEEQISTKEDFEELIDEDSKKDNVIKTTDVIHTKHINEIHKYAAFFSPKTEASTSVANFIANSKKISLITTPVVHTKSEILKNPDAKVVSVSSGSKVTNIILHSGMRTNVLSVPKLVTTGSSAITIVSASSSPITSMLPSSFTVPVISASAVRQLPNVKVIDKPSSSISLTTHENLPKKIFENEPPETKIPEVAKPTSEEVKSDSEKIDTSSVKNQIISQTSAPVIIHNTPELKMTAQVIQETQSGMQITARTESSDGFEATDDTKSVVISIPSPTPSQEQMLDNIALQALENRRRDGNGIPGEFESFEDVLDMIENITGEPPTVIEGGNEKHEQKVEEKAKNVENNPPKTPAVPQLSPLSQPTDLTTNMANASQQLRSLLSSLHTGTITSTSNVETVVKSVTNVTLAAPPIVTSRVVQQPISNSVILGSKKTVVTVAKPNQSLSFLTSRSTSEIQLMPEHPMLPRVSSIGTSANDNTRKATYSLTEMLQSHPAATSTTKISVDTITAASLLGSAVGLSRSGFSTSLVQAQPHVVVSPQISNVQTSTATFKPVTSNLLHTHLTKVIRSKSVEELKEIKPEEIKIENIEIANETKPDVAIKQEPTGCKLSIISTIPSSREDSQNVLLKKLLQNTACASTQTPQPVTSAAPITVASPMQFNSSNLENQLKASTPTLTSILPPVAKETPVVAQAKPPVPQRTPVMTRETSFVSNPSVQQSATQQLHIDIKKCMPPSRTPSRDELLSPPTPRSSCSQDSSLQTPPLIIKKEPGGSTQQMMQEVKKEFIDENSQHSEVSDISSCNVQMKEEIDSLDATEKMLQDKEMIKKMKRRMYQQKRRQNQINKDVGGQPKKRPRKSSRVDEDYDTYIDGVMAQLRNLPPMVVSEPILNRNFNILPVFGGDFAKLSASDYDTRYGELRGDYGNAVVPGYSNFYNTQPYGDLEPLPEKPPTSTQRGFYDNEFALIKFDSDEDKRFDVFCREDTPDSVISSSSPECPVLDPPHKFLGLRLIDEDEDEEEEMDVSRMRLSPVVPIVTPIPIRLKDTGGQYLKDYTDDKENIGREVCLKSKFGQTPTTPLKDSGNVTVTLTLTSSAAEDIMGVLRDLANILHIPAPTSYQIVERTSTPPSQKLGLYRTKGKDGKEGAPIDIQSILNGEAKFCKHCDVVILNNMIRKKVSELPFLSKDSELLSDGDELFFCSSTCYMQFALMHRSPSISEDKAAAIIDHLCQKDKSDVKGKRPFLEGIESKRHFVDNMEMELHCYKKSVNVESPFFTRPSDVIKIRKYDEPRIWRNTRYKAWIPGCLQPPSKHKKPTDKEIMELLYRMGITVTPSKLPEDTRKCMFCQGMGDGVADGPARLLNFDVDKWVHLNCGLWSDGVYETVNGALMNLDNSLQQSLTQTCIHCNKLGATIRCFKTRCSNVYHLSCAVKDGCVFYKNKTTYCTVHIPKSEKDNELTTLSVSRRVYVNRDENRQVAAVMHHSDTNNLLRVGNLIFLSVGQLLPHQLQNFHTANYIYPIGYKIIRFYWSMRRLNKRCRYICSIQDVLGRPEFRVVIQEPPAEDVEFKHLSPKGVWQPILEQIALMRRQNQCVQVFPKFVSGEDLFGLTEPAVVRVLESLPGIETLTDYKFKYGRNPLLELPLAINPTGAARTEPRLRNQLHWKRPHTQRTSGGSSQRPLFGPSPSAPSPSAGLEVACPYSKQFVHSKSSQYKKMKQEWRNNVFLARSKIQGLGLYAARDLEKHTMVIEYIGEIIRSELAETREKKYEAKNRGIYMFRLDEERVVDATLCGGLARYINHSCNPNCVAETVEVDRDCRIIIFAKRRIQRGEELAYDYKFDIEDDQHKISCMCGAPNCRKWMN